MKQLYFFLFLIILGGKLFSQSSICDIGAGCSDTPLVFPNTFNGNNAESGANYGCLSTQPNPAWYFLGFDEEGDVDIEIRQVDTDGNLIDVDFICYGPFNDPFIACNNLSILNASTEIDCSYSTSAVENLNIVNAQIGEFYILLITNFAQEEGSITMSQTNAGQPGAGSTDCSYACSVNLGDDKTLCLNNDITLTTTLGNASMEDTATYKWYKNNVEISGATSDTYSIVGSNTIASDIYRVEVLADLCEDAAIDEIQIDYVDVISNLNTTSISTLKHCNANNDGFDTFNLTENEAEIANTENALDYTFTYYTDSALTQLINNPTAYNNETAYNQTIYVTIVHNSFIGCEGTAEFNLEVVDTPIANSINDWFVCDDNNDGFFEFDLASLNADILNGQDATINQISFHHSQEDADDNLNALPLLYTNATAYTLEEIFIRVESMAYSACFSTTSFSLQVSRVPIANIVPDYFECDDNNDGYFEFNLALFDALVLDGQNQNDYSISYHHNQDDANNNTSQLPLMFTNENVFTPETIFVRIENNVNTACFATNSFTINVIETPIANPVNDWFVCDDDNDGFYEFDLETLKDTILNGQDVLNSQISFHHSQEDADDNLNALPLLYTNTDPFTIEEVFVRIESVAYADCYSTTSFSIKVIQTPVANQLNDWIVCDDEDNDGFYIFDLSSLYGTLLNGQDDTLIDIKFYQSQVDLDYEITPLPLDYINKVAFGQEEIFVKMKSTENENCLDTTSFIIQVVENPIFDIVEDTKYICVNLLPQTISFEIENMQGNYSYSWQDSDGNELSTSTLFEATQVGDYTITATTIDGNDCSTTKTVHLLPAEPATVVDYEINEFWEKENFSLDISVFGSGIYQYAIDNINGPYQDSPIITNISPGVHTVYVKEMNDCGISSKTIDLFGYSPFFTPNDDGIHDIWKVQGIYFKPKAKIYIFDRLGKLLAQFYPALNEGWDGNYNGKSVPEGEYWFTAEMTNHNGEPIIRKGHFSLIRTNN